MAHGHHGKRAFLEIETAVAGLTLRGLTAEQAEEYYALIDRNREHLTQHGDYQALAAADRKTARAELLDDPDPSRTGAIARMRRDGATPGERQCERGGQGAVGHAGEKRDGGVLAAQADER